MRKILIIIALTIILFGVFVLQAVAQQNYVDDIYYRPSKDKKLKIELRDSLYLQDTINKKDSIIQELKHRDFDENDYYYRDRLTHFYHPTFYFSLDWYTPYYINWYRPAVYTLYELYWFDWYMPWYYNNWYYSNWYYRPHNYIWNQEHRGNEFYHRRPNMNTQITTVHRRPKVEQPIREHRRIETTQQYERTRVNGNQQERRRTDLQNSQTRNRENQGQTYYRPRYHDRPEFNDSHRHRINAERNDNYIRPNTEKRDNMNTGNRERNSSTNSGSNRQQNNGSSTRRR